MSNDIAITSQPGATVGTAAAIFSPEGWIAWCDLPP